MASLVGRLSFSVFDRGERERGRSAAVAEEHEGAAQNAQLEAGGVLVAAIHEVEHTAAIETELATHLMPAAREAADLRRRIHQQGDATLLEVLQSERAAVAAASRLARARGATVWARVKLWLLLTSLTTPTTTER